MFAAATAALLAVAVPSDKLSSVAVAAYWYKKDARGRGDSISEQSKPRRYPAFAVADDTFFVADPFVRVKHLDRIEIWFKGEKIPAQEVARVESPAAVVLKAARPVEGIVPLGFKKGAPTEKIVWEWCGDTLVARASGVGTNDAVSVMADTGRACWKMPRNALYLDKDRNPVGLGLGGRVEIGGNIGNELVSPVEVALLPADAYETAASAMERCVADASLALLFRLETEDKENGRRRSFYSDDDEGKNEIDALGFAVAGRVIVQSSLGEKEIARLSKAEATFPDGSTTNLVFAGALAEWNALVFDVPESFKGKLKPLEIATDAPESFDNRVAWVAQAENENGRVVATAKGKGRFFGVGFIRGAKFVPALLAHMYDDDDPGAHGSVLSQYQMEANEIVLDAAGRLVQFPLARRFSADRWSRDDFEFVSTADLARFLAGECFNPNLVPRKEEDRNRLAWLGVETVRLTDALARERKAQSFVGRYSRPPYVTEVYAGSPAAKASLAVGDVLLAVRRGNERERELETDYDYSTRDWGFFFSSDSFYTPRETPWPNVENKLNNLLTTFGAGATVTIVYARDGQRKEASVVLEAAPPHYGNAPKARNRALGLSVRDMTFEVRRYFKFDEAASGVVIAKVKPGSPAAVAGLRPYELVTEVNGEKVAGAKDFAAKIKDKKDLVFSVRRLAQTRLVKIHIEPETDKDEHKEKGKSS